GDEGLEPLEQAFAELEDDACRALGDQGFARAGIRIERRLALKYSGTDSTLLLPFPDREQRSAAAIEKQFVSQYRKRYGFAMAGRALIVESISVEAVGEASGAVETEQTTIARQSALEPTTRRRVFFDDWHETPFYDRDALISGDLIAGPAVILERNTTTVVEPGWQAEVTRL